MSKSLKARSPRVIKVTGTGGQVVKAELYIFRNGQAVPTSPTYTLEKTIPTTTTYASFNVSDFARSNISYKKHVDVTTVTDADVDTYTHMYVKIYINGVFQTGDSASYTHEFTCTNGFGYSSEGFNPTIDKPMEGGTYHYHDTDNAGSIYVYNPQDLTSGDYYIRWSDLGSVTTITTITDFEINQCPAVHPSFIANGNKVEVFRLTTKVFEATFEPKCEKMYTPVKVDFVNKQGFWQRVFFFKNSEENISIDSKNYQSKQDDPEFNYFDKSETDFNINGREFITLNTGFVDEDFFEIVKQIALSEYIVIDETHTVLIDSKEIKKQTHLTEKTINYKMKFKHSHNTINQRY